MIIPYNNYESSIGALQSIDFMIIAQLLISFIYNLKEFKGTKKLTGILLFRNIYEISVGKIRYSHI